MSYNLPIVFEWDEQKSEACFQYRGFDFLYAARAFVDTQKIVEEDLRRVYGERRFRLMGKIEHRLFVVVYTKRQGAVRIISARKANQREMHRYENRTSHTGSEHA